MACSDGNKNLLLRMKTTLPAKTISLVSLVLNFTSLPFHTSVLGSPME